VHPILLALAVVPIFINDYSNRFGGNGQRQHAPQHVIPAKAGIYHAKDSGFPLSRE
jgi:hypothetical protein